MDTRWQMGWGRKIVLQLVLVIVPLAGLLLVQTLFDLWRAESLVQAFPAHVAAAKARAEFNLFVDGLADAVDTGKLASAAREALELARRDSARAMAGDPLAAETERQLAALSRVASEPEPLKALMPLRTQIGTANKALEQLDERLRTQLQEAIDAARAEARSEMVIALLITGFIVLTSAWFARSMIRTLTRPLHEAIARAQAIAGGDLQPIRTTGGNDETSQLLRALAAMTGALRAVVAKVRASSDGIGTASQEIASGSVDLSARTEQAASSLQQTTSSVGQLLQMIKRNAENAQKASALAASASAVADRGGEAVSKVAGTMLEIAERSQKIGSIIGVIDGIAFQTNILALNAAVEAARAGEQGRGFAVVAAEVRALAGRSADAAREIKSLVGASIEGVHSGSDQARDAGATMQDLVTQVRHVSVLIEEINRGSNAQSTEIDQVNGAVRELERMTQQNAALVEQSTAAARMLEEQGRNLAQAVAVFSAEDGDSGGWIARPRALPLTQEPVSP
jgi:methyl-accepting chemotaxis protein